MTTQPTDTQKLMDGLVGLIGTEDSSYNAGWNDAIRHVIMDLKTGCYRLAAAPVASGQAERDRRRWCTNTPIFGV